MKRELDALVEAIDNAVGKAPTSLVLSILTGSFVGLVSALAEQAGHNPDEQIKVDGGESRDITIHAAKGCITPPSLFDDADRFDVLNAAADEIWLNLKKWADPAGTDDHGLRCTCADCS